MTDPVPLTAEERLDGAWRALIADLHAEFDQGHMKVAAIVASGHREAIEAAARDRSTPSVDGLREPDQPDPIETFSHPFRAPVNIDGHLFTHTSDCPWPLDR